MLLTTMNCSQSSEMGKNEINFLNHYAVGIETSSTKAPKGEPFYYLQEGWLRKGKKTMMILPQSKIRFFSLEEKPRTLLLELSMGDFTERPEYQNIQLHLNGKPLENLKLSSNSTSEKHRFQLKVTGNYINKGSNYLEINVLDNDLERQKEGGYLYLHTFQIKNYQKIKSFSFSKIDGRNLIVQPSKSWFEYFVLPRSNEILNFSFRVTKVPLGSQITGRVLVKLKQEGKEEIPLKEIDLNQDKSTIYQGNIELAPYADNLIGLYVYFISDNPDIRLTWDPLILENKQISRGKNPQEGEENPVLKEKPHIFVIILDAARYDQCQLGMEEARITPHMNAFSKQAYNFRHCYVQAPYTTASVATLLSGLYPESHAVRTMDDEIPDNVHTLALYLKEKGYQSVAASGSIALIRNHFFEDFDQVLNIRKNFPNRVVMETQKLKESINELNFTKPNFYYIHLLPPHEPYNPPQQYYINDRKPADFNQARYIRLRDQANLYANPKEGFTRMVHDYYMNNMRYADFLVGEVLKILKAKKVFDESIIVVSSDHGEAFFEHKEIGHNTTNYNDMIQIPFLLKMPYQKQGKEVMGNFGLIDLAPTILGLLEIKTKNRMQGKSFSPLLMGIEMDVSQRFLYSRAVSQKHNLSIIQGGYKFIYNCGRQELYNIRKDPDEINNIINQHPVLSGYLRQMAFIRLYRNRLYRKNHHINKKEVQDKGQYKGELQSLGYL